MMNSPQYSKGYDDIVGYPLGGVWTGGRLRSPVLV